MLNRMVWNGTVFGIEIVDLCETWFGWNRTVYMYKNGFCIK